MATPPDPIDTMIDAATQALGIKVDPSWKPAIRGNLLVTLRLGAIVTAFSLPDDAEPGPVFKS